MTAMELKHDIHLLRKDAETYEQRHARQRQDMLDELREAFRELDEIKAGKIKPLSIEEFIKELKEELEAERYD